ncbi:MAG: putative metal-binding motif-containing protein [Alphaproteobacteria bacterium]|nr:putative metal-binding motif-containing protein [Alphaproteobacteria bacterium]
MRLAVLLVLHGCVFVGEGKLEEWRLQIDEDEDGSPLEDDCNDRDPLRSPDFEEIPYDGIDNDCDGTDLLDVDGDGQAGIAEADWTGTENGFVWPFGFTEVDCDDTDPNTAPYVLSDLPYDGIDQDCDGDNDYDQDGDGFVARGYTQADIDAYVARWPHIAAGSITVQGFDDCNDGNSAVFPGAAEVPYDGHDNDCDDGDDYDQDGDGYFWDGITASEYGTFCLTYPVACSGALEGDCGDDSDIVYPGAFEVPNDGIDNDCDGDGLDADQDGAPDCDFAPGPDCDCDDTDPAVNPDVLEVLGDGIDDDCGGNGDGARWRRTTASWERLGRPGVAATPDGWAVGVTSVSDTISTSQGVLASRVVVLGAPPSNVHTYQGIAVIGSRTPGEWIDAVAVGSTVYAATTSFLNDRTFFDLGRLDFSASLPTVTADSDNVLGLVDPVRQVEVQQGGGGTIWTTACFGTTAAARYWDSPLPEDSELFTFPANGTACTSDLAAGQRIEVCDATGCEAQTIDTAGTVAAATSRWPALDVTTAQERDGWWAFTLASDGVLLDDGTTTYDLLAGEPIVGVDAVPLGGSEVAVVAAFGGGDPHVSLLYGVPGSLVEVRMPDDAGGRVPKYVGIDYEGGLIGVFATFDSTTPLDDVLAWAWLSY